jgi:Type II secretion system (T2SS), protein E, N-terminal domain
MSDRKRKKLVDDVLQDVMIPKLWTLRRISGRYRYLLPVAVMKRYQCVIVGGEGSILTVAITRPKDTHIFHAISVLTGCTIFPVLVDPVRMRLLIRRIERLEYAYYASMNSLAFYYAFQQRSLLLFLIARYER